MCLFCSIQCQETPLDFTHRDFKTQCNHNLDSLYNLILIDAKMFIAFCQLYCYRCGFIVCVMCGRQLVTLDTFSMLILDYYSKNIMTVTTITTTITNKNKKYCFMVYCFTLFMASIGVQDRRFSC